MSAPASSRTAWRRPRKAVDELQDIANEAGTGPLRALARLAAGLVAARSGDPKSARALLEDAVDLFEESGAPFETGRARVELAGVMRALGSTEAAAAEAQRAIADLTPLGADLELARARAVLDAPATDTAAASPPSDDPSVLTPRQIEILRLISTGLNNQAIADRLFISEHTVHRHVANTLTKLNVSSRSAAVAQAARLGLLYCTPRSDLKVRPPGQTSETQTSGSDLRVRPPGQTSEVRPRGQPWPVRAISLQSPKMTRSGEAGNRRPC